MSMDDQIAAVLSGESRWCVVCGDCLDILRQLPDGCVDAVVTDPPFFMPAQHYAGRSLWQRKWSDTSILGGWWGGVCDELRRVTKETGHVLSFCNADAFAVFYPAMYCRWPSLHALVWDKMNPGLGTHWRHQHEFVIAARGPDAWSPNDGIMRRDVLRHAPTPSKDRVHPVEKPVPVLRELVESVAPEGGVVLDPFAGSGTTGLAAILGGRRFIGSDADGDYCETARARIAPKGALL